MKLRQGKFRVLYAKKKFIVKNNNLWL